MKENLPLLIIAIAALAAAAGIAYAWLSARRQYNETQLLRAEIKKWEDEGGNVPEVAAQGALPEPPTERLQSDSGDTARRTTGHPVVS